MTIDPNEAEVPQERLGRDDPHASCNGQRHSHGHLKGRPDSGWVSIVFDSWATTARVTAFAVVLLVVALACLWLLGIEIAVGPVEIHR